MATVAGAWDSDKPSPNDESRRVVALYHVGTGNPPWPRADAKGATSCFPEQQKQERQIRSLELPHSMIVHLSLTVIFFKVNTSCGNLASVVNQGRGIDVQDFASSEVTPSATHTTAQKSCVLSYNPMSELRAISSHIRPGWGGVSSLSSIA